MTVYELLLVFIGIFMVGCLVSIWYASTHFHKVFYRLSSTKISKPVKLVLLSDLHDTRYGADNEKLLQAIYEEQPDGILIAGDMLTAAHKRKTRVAEDFVEALSARYPVYYGLGNHEAKMGWNRAKYGAAQSDFLKRISDAGVRVLQNEHAEFAGANICIYGLDMEEAYYKRGRQTPMEEDYVAQKLGENASHKYNILLAHNPAYFDTYANWQPDLVVSGHVHGGLVRLPVFGGVIAPSLKLFPKYDGGRFISRSATMILSRGLGIHSIEFRMWNPGEVIVAEIAPAAKE